VTISQIVVAILWQQIFSPVGLYPAIMRIVKNDPRYVVQIFENKTYCHFFQFYFVILWIWTGLYMLIFLANLQKINPSMIEAAVIDGAREGKSW